MGNRKVRKGSPSNPHRNPHRELDEHVDVQILSVLRTTWLIQSYDAYDGRAPPTFIFFKSVGGSGSEGRVVMHHRVSVRRCS